MRIQIDKMSAPSSRERAQQLYDKVLELDNRRRRSAQARVPSDPNAWQQIRENYEAIILEDHAFSEQHSIEYALWQLHYRRIEELRAHFNTALSSGSNQAQSAKGPPRPDRVTKIRLQFKTFLSEASGFYHDLIVKIRAKYGLPLGHFSESSENQNVTEKDGKRSSEVKKGLNSCHRCLIYLGDLARYKGLYGEGDSKSREFAAASSYYLQAASLLPSSGNPHHQLAILASYSGDELLAVYRYFRSLAVDSPFVTARENLVVAFEKNRNAYTQLLGEATGAKELPAKLTGKTRGRGEGKNVPKDIRAEPIVAKEGGTSLQDKHKEFYIRFVRLNGILFTRTSLEIFAEVLSLVSSGLSKLLSGPEEEPAFGADAVESGLIIVRLVSILIYTIHNVNRESEGTYADILQRKALLNNAYTAVYKLMGHFLERCAELSDPSSSSLLPGILIFAEWMACCPEVSSGSGVDENEAVVRSKFWNIFVSFLNKLVSVGSVSIGYDEDETCFNNMSSYDEGNTDNRLALWEDFELRGFSPLVPAQTFLDFSRKHSFGGDGKKEKKARSERILAAGKVLASMVKVDKKEICFDPRGKKFVIGALPPVLDDDMVGMYSGIPHTNDLILETQAVERKSQQHFVEADDEDEVIVFKPMVSEKRPDVLGANWANHEGLKPNHEASTSVTVPSSAHLNNIQHQTAFGNHFPEPPIPVSIVASSQYLQPVQPHVSKWLTEEAYLSDSLQGLRFAGNSNGVIPNGQGGSNLVPLSLGALQPPNVVPTSGILYNHTKPQEVYNQSMVDSVSASAANSNAFKAPVFPLGVRRAPVGRPTRHLGPPPGFSRVRAKHQTTVSAPDLVPSENPITDDYSWLDGYQGPPLTKSSAAYPSHSQAIPVANANGFSGTVNFPFPAKLVPTAQPLSENQKGWNDFSMLDSLKMQHEHLMQQQQQQQVVSGGNHQHVNSLPEQYPGQSGWNGRFFV